MSEFLATSFIHNIGSFITALALWYTTRIMYGFLFQSSMRLLESSRLRAVFFLILSLFFYALKSFFVIWGGRFSDNMETAWHIIMPLIVSITLAAFITEMSKE